MRRVLRSLALVLLVAVVGIPSCIAVRSHDLPEPGDADLTVARAEIASGANGYADLEAAVAHLYYPTKGTFDARVLSVLRGEREPGARFAKVLGRNAGALESVRRVLAAEHLEFPVRSFEDLARPIEYMPLAKLLAIEAQLLARQGRTRASLQASLQVVDLGQRIASAGGATFIDAMIGNSMKLIGSESLRGSLPHLRIAQADAHWAAEALAAYRSDPAGWSRMWAVEYQFSKRGFAQLTAEELTPLVDATSFSPLQLLPDAYTYQRNRTLAELAVHYRALQRASALPCAQLADVRRETRWPGIVWVFDRNGVGRVLNGTMEPTHWDFQDRRCLSDTALSATQAQLGLRAYQIEHGDLPDALQALVPAYLSALPRDGFDGEPLRYSRAARRLHSLGSDQIDRGGEARRRDHREFLLEPIYPIRF